MEFEPRRACAPNVDDRPDTKSDRRKRLVRLCSREIVVGDDGVSKLVPREGWRPYMKATLTAPRVLAERKTGVKHAEVITARLLQDERGWLRLAV